MVTQRPAWELLLEAARDLTRRGRSPFSLDSLIRTVQQIDPNRERGSLSPVVQGMTANASGGPQPACGEVLHRVDRGMYELLETDQLEVALVRSPDEEAAALTPSVPTSGDVDSAIAFMRSIHRTFESRGEVGEIIAARDQVLDRYRPIFDPSNLNDLTAEEFRGFLLFRNNRHWDGIHRQGSRITEDMDRVREGLGILLDESQPLIDRLDLLVRFDGPNFIPGLAKAVLTPILLVVYPDLYGVWNNIAEAAMRRLGVFPEFDRGEGFGKRYDRVTAVLREMSEGIGIDLWTLDSLWWAVEEKLVGRFDADADTDAPTNATMATAGPIRSGARFGLERHLHDFLRDNWDETELGEGWLLYEEGGDLVGYEFPTDVGRIDLLARHRTEPRWLVIELKRAQSDDVTVGQLARYMGWVQQELASEGETVEGLVISSEGGDKIRYALQVVPNASLRTYEVEFRLKPA